MNKKTSILRKTRKCHSESRSFFPGRRISPLIFSLKLSINIIILLLLPAFSIAQEVNIVPYLRSIEEGDKEKVISSLGELKNSHPDDPSVIFLDAVLTENGEEALKKYEVVYTKYPQSNYADASLYRIFSYYYSLGIYNKAEAMLNELKAKYPTSPYIKAADRSIPDETIQDIPGEKIAGSQTEQVENYNYTIQAGAFLNVENAKNLIAEIEKDGYPAELSTKSVGGSLLNVVTFGRLQTEEEAAPLFDYLKKKFNLNGRIISVN